MLLQLLKQKGLLKTPEPKINKTTDPNISNTSLSGLEEEEREILKKTSQKHTIMEENYLVEDFKNEELNELKEYIKHKLETSKKQRLRVVKTTYSRFKTLFMSYDKFWVDIFLDVFYHIQILGLLWIFPFSYPKLYLKYSFFYKFFNFDFISNKKQITDNNSFIFSWSMEGILGVKLFYPFYLIPALILPISLLFLYWVIPKIKKINDRYYYSKWLFFILQIIYLPTLIHLLVFGTCSSDGNSFFGKCKFYCSYSEERGIGAFCLTQSIPSILIGVTYGVGQPLLLYIKSQKIVVYKSNQKHSHMVSNLEVEKGLKISNRYVYGRLHIISSFTRVGSTYYYLTKHFVVLLSILAWVLFLPVSFRKVDGKINETNQIILNVIVFVLFLFKVISELIVRPYRLASRLIVQQILGWSLVINLILSWFKSIDIENPFFVDSSLFMMFILINILSIFIVFSFFIIFLIFKFRWPVNGQVIKRLETNYSHYLTAIRDGFLLYEHALHTTPSFVRCDLILYHKKYLQKLYQEAVLNNNPLFETFEDLILKLEEEYYANEPITLLPQKTLQNKIGDLRNIMDRREEEMVLIPQKNRILLLKILSYNAFRKLAGKKDILHEFEGEKKKKIDDIMDLDGIEQIKQKKEEVELEQKTGNLLGLDETHNLLEIEKNLSLIKTPKSLKGKELVLTPMGEEPKRVLSPKERKFEYNEGIISEGDQLGDEKIVKEDVKEEGDGLTKQENVK